MDINLISLHSLLWPFTSIVGGGGQYYVLLRHHQSMTPPQLGRAYNFVWTRLPPAKNEVNPKKMVPPTAANLSAGPPRFHRRHRFPRPAASNEDLLPSRLMQFVATRWRLWPPILDYLMSPIFLHYFCYFLINCVAPICCFSYVSPVIRPSISSIARKTHVDNNMS